MPDLEFTIENTEEIADDLELVLEALFEEGGKAEREFLEEMVTRIKADEDFPVLTGALRASGRADGPIRESEDVILTGAGFGAGPSASYAEEVHENSQFNSKYFEEPAFEILPGAPRAVGRWIANKIKAVIITKAKHRNKNRGSK